MFETYIPGFSNMLMNSDMLTFQPELTGGGPAYATITPDFMPEPAEGPAPAAVTPQDDFLERIRRAEAMVPVAQPPSIMPSPSAPPIMSAPGFGAPGFTNMLMRPDLLEGGPAYADMMPGTMGGAIDQVSMLPFAPEAPAAAPASYVPGFSPMLLNQAVSAQPERAISGFEDYERTLGSLNPALEYEQSAGRVGGQSVFDPTGLTFLTDRGRSAGYGANKSGFVAFDPNAQYRMFDERGKNRIVSEGKGEEGLRNIYSLANQFNKEQGKKANWGIERLNPATGQWERILENDPSKNILGKIADVALPIALSFTPLGPIGGAAVGSALSSAAQGRSLKNTLLRAGLSAATAGAMQATGADKAISGALGKAFAPAAAEATKTGAQKAAEAGLNEIIVSGSRSALPSILSSGVGGGLSGQLASMAPGKGADFADRVFEQPTTPAVQVPSPLDTVAGDPINVIASRIPTGGALPFATAGAGTLAQAGVDAAINSIKQQIEQKQAEQEPENEIVVRPKEPLPIGALLGPAVLPDLTKTPVDVPNPADANVGTLNIPEDEIVVTAPEKAPTSFDEKVTPPLAPTLPDLTKTPVDVQGPEKDLIDQLKDRIKGLDVVDYLRLAGVLLPLLDGGGGGSRASRTLPSGMFGGSSIFSGGLPRATLPGASTGFAPRTAADLRPKTTQDWYRYGYGPEQSFFSYVPEGERNTSQAYTGYAHGGMAEGGERFAVNGPGTGRSDEIPAMLSDGEYVIDAETVALLGDGSSKAGAERLDQFRINVRKHKGRHLAKGDFSVNAKRPEKYLKGGRA